MTDIKNVTHPKKFSRSDIIVMNIDYKFDINRDHIIKKKWTIYAMFPNKTICNKSIELINNPTIHTYNLVIKSNTLEYGLYQLKFHVELLVNLERKSVGYENLIETHIEVVPGGIAVFSLENGLDSLRIGTEQSIKFDTIKYAYDMDFLYDIRNLEKLNFYCFKMNIKRINDTFNINEKRFEEITTQGQDLANFKKNSILYNECIDNRNKIYFYQNNKILMIEAESWPFDPNSFSLFLVEAYYLNKRYFQFIKVEKLNVPFVPEGSTR